MSIREDLVKGLPKVHQLDTNTMDMSAKEKTLLRSFMTKTDPQASDVGAQALERLLIVYPWTQKFFSHIDKSPGSADLLNTGGKMMNALGNAVRHLDNPDAIESSLSDLHNCKELTEKPENFKLLSQNIKGVMAARYPNDFTPNVQSAWDKFMSNVSSVLTSKYK